MAECSEGDRPAMHQQRFKYDESNFAELIIERIEVAKTKIIIGIPGLAIGKSIKFTAGPFTAGPQQGGRFQLRLFQQLLGKFKRRFRKKMNRDLQSLSVNLKKRFQ